MAATRGSTCSWTFSPQTRTRIGRGAAAAADMVICFLEECGGSGVRLPCSYNRGASVVHSYLTAPLLTPAEMYFWARTNRMIAGTEASMAVAITALQLAM